MLGQLLFSETDSTVRQQTIETIALQAHSEVVYAFLHIAAQGTNRSIREFTSLNLAAWN